MTRANAASLPVIVPLSAYPEPVSADVKMTARLHHLGVGEEQLAPTSRGSTDR
jgi:hypothetical protein